MMCQKYLAIKACYGNKAGNNIGLLVSICLIAFIVIFHNLLTSNLHILSFLFPIAAFPSSLIPVATYFGPGPPAFINASFGPLTPIVIILDSYFPTSIAICHTLLALIATSFDSSTSITTFPHLHSLIFASSRPLIFGFDISTICRPNSSIFVFYHPFLSFFSIHYTTSPFLIRVIKSILILLDNDYIIQCLVNLL